MLIIYKKLWMLFGQPLTKGLSIFVRGSFLKVKLKRPDLCSEHSLNKLLVIESGLVQIRFFDSLI